MTRELKKEYIELVTTHETFEMDCEASLMAHNMVLEALIERYGETIAYELEQHIESDHEVIGFDITGTALFDATWLSIEAVAEGHPEHYVDEDYMDDLAIDLYRERMLGL